MYEGDFLFYEGKILRSGTLLISPNNRSFRYGDGCFETMKLLDGHICLSDYHFERLLISLELLKFRLPVFFTADWLKKQVLVIATKNGHSKAARVRLTVTRGEGGVYDEQEHHPYLLIQTWSLSETVQELNQDGVAINVFPDARKAMDRFASIKSNNYLPYIMGALWAKEHKLNDAIILNAFDRVADTTIANIFIVKDGVIKTSALDEGPVNGVMRRHILHTLREENIPVEEGIVTMDDLANASEIWLSNAIAGVKWVGRLGDHQYGNTLALQVYRMLNDKTHKKL